MPDIEIKDGLGCEPDLYDYRDRFFSASVADEDVPASVAQFDLDFPIYDQGSDNACVGFSYKEAAQIVLKQTHGIEVSISASFLWYLGRRAIGMEKSNYGCRIRDVIQGANKYGVPTTVWMPWTPGGYTLAPTAAAFERAADHPAFDYEVVDTVRAAKVACAKKHPVIFGTVLTESFEKARRNGGFFPVPAGSITGGHAMLIVGYDDDVVNPEWGTRGAFRLRNHYRAEWGDKGWGWLPYAHFSTPAVSDAWVLRGIRAQHPTREVINV